MKRIFLFILFLGGIPNAKAAIPAPKAAEPFLLKKYHSQSPTVKTPPPITGSLWKWLLKRKSLQNGMGKADRMAKTSWWIGLIALLCVLYPWYNVLLAIPLGIIAIALAKEARKSGSNKRNGRGLGTIALVLVLAWAIIAAAILSMSTMFDGYSLMIG